MAVNGHRIADCRKLTCYFGERHRIDGRFVADELLDTFGRNGLAVSVMLRGAEGFGVKHQLRSDVSLSLSEDLPAVAIAVDTAEAIEPVAGTVAGLPGVGLVTLERARLVPTAGVLPPPPAQVSPDPPGVVIAADQDQADATRLSVFIGRGRRARRAPAYLAVCDLLFRRGIAGTTVLLGVDGTVRGERRRAKFFGGNLDVPAMVLAVGDEAQVSAVLPELSALVPDAVLTLERATICKRDGRLLRPPPRLPDTDADGRSVWQKVSVFAAEDAPSDGLPLHRALTRSLQRAGASGVTTLRGVWGYHGAQPPHGDRLFQVGRRVPTVTVVIDRPDAIARLFPTIDELTSRRGLVISELVPAVLARGGTPLDRTW